MTLGQQGQEASRKRGHPGGGFALGQSLIRKKVVPQGLTDLNHFEQGEAVAPKPPLECQPRGLGDKHSFGEWRSFTSGGRREGLEKWMR